MKKSTQIIIAVLVIIVVPIVYFTNKRLAAQTLVGCYVARNDKNIYTLTIQSHDMTVVKGILNYNNYQFDDSAGSIEGSFLNNTLLVDYSSRAEGMDFVSQISFRKDGDSFIQGDGAVQQEGNRLVLVNPGNVSYENGNVFKKDDSCNK